MWERFREGDDEALSYLFKVYADELFSYGIAILKDEDLVKDCIQEVFIQLINKREKLVISDQIHVYLFKSLRNKIFEELRTSKRKQVVLDVIKEDSSLLEKDAEDSIIAAEKTLIIKEKIENALNNLSDRQKEAIFLKYTEGFDYDEIAYLLGMDKASARTLVYRALKSVRKMIGSESLVLFYAFLKKKTCS